MAQTLPSEFMFYEGTDFFEPLFIERSGLSLKEYFFRKHQKLKNTWRINVYNMSDAPVNEYYTSLKKCDCLAGQRNIDCKHKQMLRILFEEQNKNQKR